MLASPQMVEPLEMTSAPMRAGFAGLYERHYEAVFRTALRVTGHGKALALLYRYAPWLLRFAIARIGAPKRRAL